MVRRPRVLTATGPLRYVDPVNRSATQFAVAFLAVLFLGVATVAAVVGEIFYGKSSELTFALVTGLVGSVGQATAFLFRLNGSTGG